MKTKRPTHERDQSKIDNHNDVPAAPSHGGTPGKKGFLLNSLPWLSVPVLFLLAILYLHALDVSTSYQHPQLTFLLGFVFMTFGGVLIAFLAGRSFLSQSMPSLLMLGCGALILASGSVASTAIDPKDINGQIAVYNICFCFSAFCHLAGALIKPRQTKAMSSAPGVWLGVALLFSLSLVWIVRVLVIDGLVPPFFIQGQGGTPLRQGVLISAIGMFVFSAALLRQPKPKSTRFSNWYALALVLIGVGLLGVLLQHSQASLIGWTGRAAQYLGGACMLIAAVVSVRESRAWRLTIETALKESEQRWDITLASIGDAVIAADMAGRVTFLNKMAEELTGWTMAEASGKPVNQVFLIVNEHTRAVAEDPVSKVLRSGKIVGLANHTVLLRKGGGEIPIDDSGAPIRGEEGHTLGVVLIFRDITERKRAEEALYRLSQFPEENPNPILRVATDGEVLYVNDPARKWLAILGWQAEGPLPVDVRDIVADARGQSHAVQGEIRNSDASTFWIFAIQPPGEDYVNVYAIDITKRRQSEEALLQSQTELKKANDELDQKVSQRTAELSDAVRELRLANEGLNEKAAQLRALASQLTMTEQVERKRLSQFLHDGLQQHLLAAKMRLGSVAEQVGSIDLKMAVDEIEQIMGESVIMSRSLSAELSPPILHDGGIADGLEWLARWMRDKNHFNVDLAIETRPELNGDVKVLVFESVRELLFNAIKHAKVSGARVSIEQVDAARVRIAVSDEGRGFDPCQLKPAGDEGGFGLFSIRERMGFICGVLEIESALGKGSRFTLVVPVLQKPTVPLSANCSAPMVDNGKENEVSDTGAVIQVLLADDHTLFREGVARMLQKEPDIEVIGHATDGQEAIDLAGKLKPDVILMDISMPRVNGIEATRVIHREYPGICIIGLSMYEDQERAQAIRDAGALGYKTKGSAASELISGIRDCVKL